MSALTDSAARTESDPEGSATDALEVARSGHDRERPTISGPIDVRSTSLAVVAVLAVVAFLYFARSLLAPLVLGVLISYAWYPVVSFLNRRLRLPRVLGATVVVGVIVSAVAYGVLVLQEQAVVLLDRVPEIVHRVEAEFRGGGASAGEPSMLDKLGEAAGEIERAASAAAEEVAENSAPSGPVAPVPTVIVDQGRGRYVDYLLDGSLGALLFVAQVATVLLLVFFVLASGRLYRQKIVKVGGSTLSEKKETLEILDEINQQIRRFFFVMLIGALFVGVVTWLAFWWLEVEGAMLWGVIAGVASAVPYAGPAFVFVASGLSALLQFGTVGDALLVAGVSLVITSIQGNLLLPWLVGQAARLNAVAVFLGLLFWGWLWGPIGLIVATPIQLMVKTVCDRVENLRPVGEFLG